MSIHPPELDSPYGPGAWDQPPADRFLIDDTHALCTVRDFNALNEYSGSMPSGVYPGKLWRRHDGAFDRASKTPLVWMLCWYGPVDDKRCSINFRPVLLV